MVRNYARKQLWGSCISLSLELNDHGGGRIPDTEGTIVLCLFLLAASLCPTRASKGLPNAQVPSGTAVPNPYSSSGTVSATDNAKVNDP